MIRLRITTSEGRVRETPSMSPELAELRTEDYRKKGHIVEVINPSTTLDTDTLDWMEDKLSHLRNTLNETTEAEYYLSQLDEIKAYILEQLKDNTQEE